MINAAVVGLGIGVHHADAIQNNNYCRLTHISDLDIKKTEKMKKDLATKHLKVSSFNELLSEKNLDMICLATFDNQHFEQVVEGLKAGKHIFVEKPLCQTWDELIDIKDVFNNSNCCLSSNLVLRTSDLFNHVGELISNGVLGEVYSFEADYLYGRINKLTDGWRKNVDNYSVMEGGGIHMIDLMINLTCQKPSSVVSFANKFATKNSAFRYNDFHSSIFTFENGLIAKVTANFGCMHPHQHVVKIFGTDRTFIYDDLGARLFTTREEKGRAMRLNQKAKPSKKGLLINRLVETIRENKPIPDAKREFDLMSVVLASDQSLNTKKETEIRYIDI